MGGKNKSQLHSLRWVGKNWDEKTCKPNGWISNTDAEEELGVGAGGLKGEK